jgi:primosomal protein N' (replication factor Y)
VPSVNYIEVLLPLPIFSSFTYVVDKEKWPGLQAGMRVKVPFGSNKIYTGLIIRLHHDNPESYQVKEIIEPVDLKPVVLESQLDLWNWMSEYYMCPPGEVFKAAIPAQLDLGRKTRAKKEDLRPVLPLSSLNSAQSKAFELVKTAFRTTDVVLLHGITSSGKTEIYIHLIREALDQQQQVLYLLPEIALTTQIINRLKSAFGNQVSVYHSKYSVSDRIKTWNRMLSDDEPRVILGVRSAIFLPFRNPGLIIIDEEHENTYKQFDPAPRYHARDTAIMMARHQGAKVLLGTATPSIESYHNCRTGKYSLVELNERYLNLQLPEITVENVRLLRRRKQMHSHFSPALISDIEEALKNKEQVILFQNRRGFSLFLDCIQCGEVPRCKHCDVSLTYHKKDNRLHCHYCGYSIPVPKKCPACGEGELRLHGFGTEKIEEEIALMFPGARIERLDTDAAGSRKSFENLIARFETRESDILVGTQMVSKGLDFDNVRLVGIIDADTMLNYPDFRAHERSFQLISQVAGRAGRKNKRGKVIIQTSDPGHHIIRSILKNDYSSVYHQQIEERKTFSYPPFSRLVDITLKHRNINLLDESALVLSDIIKRTIDVKAIGPEYPLVSRIRNLYLKSLLVKIEKMNTLQTTKKQITEAIQKLKETQKFKSVQYMIDVDPY